MGINKYSDLEQSEIIHIFEYFDFPLFFISKSPCGMYYLNYYIEEIQDNVDKWLFCRISNKERIDLIHQKISVLELLNRLKNKERLYYLFIDSNLNDKDIELNVELVNSNNFDHESFPEEDFYVEYDYVTDTEFFKVEEDILDSSKFKMVLKDDENSHDINLDLFLNVLSNLKKSLNDVATDIGNKIMGNKSEHQVNLRIDSLQPSSFGVWIRTEPKDTDLFEVPEKSLSALFEIIEDIQVKNPIEIEEQIEIDESFSINTVKSIKKWLKEISDNEFSLKLEATTKTEGLNKVVSFDRNSFAKLDILTKILEDKSEKYTEQINIEGLLTSINTSNNRFRISTESIGEIGGKMSTDMFKRLKEDKTLQFRVPSLIKAVVEKEVINDYVEDEHSVKYTLIYFEQPVE
ncbi:hypothetical protein CD30_13160 [Ureibacillus massiliensis 4400831 = CIP 108448 = CCUG 49529]|uniref:DUF6575 domain-containing protein n=1 Tax=Ureibacillus massiliensis 4400831 = CIP 108448 = CCUG 49529 TaxID=1211035 RepID=A0A0A3IZH8_9BACL|nr:hypothetical protein CD30_13160 [Ureibacillus massiliensis 4400831 = CIP 108448 = CCUG 49529]